MVSLNQIVRFLNKELATSKFKEHSKNGLQVNASTEIKKIGFAVDACLETFNKAKKLNCQLLITHHGILWRNKKDNLKKNRISFLKKNKLSLYVSHQPLDINPKYGNNITMAKYLNLKDIKKFGKTKEGFWGYKGTLNTNLSLIIKKINNLFKTKPYCLSFGKKSIKKIAIVSGSGSFAIEEAKINNIDLLITGEIKHSTYHEAKEYKINIIAAGHYNTETLGVKSLMKPLKEKFKVQTVFIDVPTGM